MPAERFNAFISYAWVDNEPFSEGGSGWVSTFVDRLRKLLARELGRREQGDRVWLDYERMRGNDNISATIRDKLAASHLLVPIVSTGYLASRWCQQELELFLKLHGSDSGRIFPVWMSHVDDLPPALEGLLKYTFWYEDRERLCCTRWFPDIDPTDREYGRAQQKMARDMAALLRTLLPTEPTASPDPAQRQPEAPSEGEHLVLVNGGEADADEVMRIAERLWEDHRVGSVIPLVAQRDRPDFKPSEITKDLRDNLALCTEVLMLACQGPHQQVHQHLKEYQRSIAKLPNGRRPPGLTLCHRQSVPLTFRPPGMRVLPVGEGCAGDCLRDFVPGLAG